MLLYNLKCALRNIKRNLFYSTLNISGFSIGRKVNGATTFQVMVLFNKEYFLRVVLAEVVAFPVAFIIMQKWLKNFADRTDLSWWIFASAGLFALDYGKPVKPADGNQKSCKLATI